MWLIQLALRRPYTFAVLAIVILLAGGLAARNAAKDCFATLTLGREGIKREEEKKPAEPGVAPVLPFGSQKSRDT